MKLFQTKVGSSKQDLEQQNVISDLIKFLNNNIALIKEENSLLNQGSSVSLEHILEAKTKYVEQFAQMQYKLQALKRSGAIKQNAKLYEQAKIAFDVFNQLCRENRILLQANINAYDKIFKILKVKSKTTELQKFGYNKAGLVSKVTEVEKIMPAMSLNDKV